MVSKCANPDCSEVFLYLRVGKLFRAEVESGEPRKSGFGSEAGVKKPMRRIEFFWLCDTCSKKMTLVFEKNLDAKTQLLARARAAAL